MGKGTTTKEQTETTNTEFFLKVLFFILYIIFKTVVVASWERSFAALD